LKAALSRDDSHARLQDCPAHRRDHLLAARACLGPLFGLLTFTFTAR